MGGWQLPLAEAGISSGFQLSVDGTSWNRVGSNCIKHWETGSPKWYTKVAAAFSGTRYTPVCVFNKWHYCMCEHAHPSISTHADMRNTTDGQPFWFLSSRQAEQESSTIMSSTSSHRVHAHIKKSLVALRPQTMHFLRMSATARTENTAHAARDGQLCTRRWAPLPSHMILDAATRRAAWTTG